MNTGFPFQNVSWFKKGNIQNSMYYVPQNDDIIIASYPRTGTNWLRNIVLQITSKGMCFPSFPSINDCFYREVSFMEMIGPESLGKVKGLRIYKNHYRYDMVHKSRKSKILYIYRNPEDTLVSCYHFFQSFRKEEMHLGKFFEGFLSGNVEYGSYFDHVLSYLAHKDDDNLLLVSYEKLYANTREEILRIAKFLGEKFYQFLSDDESLLGKIMELTSFEYMEKNLKVILPHSQPMEDSDEETEIMDFRVDFFRLGVVGDGKRKLCLCQLKRLQERVAETMKDTEVLQEWLGK